MKIKALILRSILLFVLIIFILYVLLVNIMFRSELDFPPPNTCEVTMQLNDIIFPIDDIEQKTMLIEGIRSDVSLCYPKIIPENWKGEHYDDVYCLKIYNAFPGKHLLIMMPNNFPHRSILDGQHAYYVEIGEKLEELIKKEFQNHKAS